MEYRIFGKSDIKVSVLGYGAGHIGSPDMDEKHVEYLLNEVVDSGVNLIDTARGYGLSEERIGKFLSHRRDEVILSTKVGYGIEGVADWTYDCITRGIDYALTLMKTDYLDIVHLHTCPASTLERGEVVDALVKAKEAGKVRVIAYSGDNEDLVYAINSNRFDSIETSVNICDQRVINESIPAAANGKMGIIAKRPMANAPWRFNEQPHGHYCEEYWKRLQQMNISVEDMDMTEIALRFTTSVPGISTAIVGTTKVENLKKNIEIVEKGNLPDDVYNRIREEFSQKDDNWVSQV